MSGHTIHLGTDSKSLILPFFLNKFSVCVLMMAVQSAVLHIGLKSPMALLFSLDMMALKVIACESRYFHQIIRRLLVVGERHGDG